MISIYRAIVISEQNALVRASSYANSSNAFENKIYLVCSEHR